MNSDAKRWLEVWLDSASERVYQAPLVTALALSGYTILHSTSHGQLELGKDVIVEKGGQVYALQLKGHPGGSMTVADWNTNYEQVIQLASLPIDRGISSKAGHIPIVVTNGHVHEGVYAAIEKFNYPKHRKELNAKELKIWDRGKLLELFASCADLIWPVDLQSQLQILKMLAATGRDPIEAERYGRMIQQVLKWSVKPSRRARRERALGAILVANVVSSRWREYGDLCEVIKIHTTAILCVVVA